VEAVLPDGSFGSAEETGREWNSALSAEIGIGEALGAALDGLTPSENAGSSLLLQAWRARTPVTVHVAIGTDTPHTHPAVNPAILGAATHHDFRLFAALVADLNEGGVYINAGSAVVMPEVFLKALSAVRNLGRRQRLPSHRSPRDHDPAHRRGAHREEFVTPHFESETPVWGFGEILVAAASAFLAMMLIGIAALHLLGSNAKLGYWIVVEESAAYLVLFAVIKAFFEWHRQPMLPSLGWLPQRAFSPLSLAGIGLLLLFGSVLLMVMLRTPDLTDSPFEKVMFGDRVSYFVLSVFSITAAPAVEELFFRGFLQPVLVSAAGVFPGILITSALFGGMHVSQYGSWQSGVALTAVGFGFGVVRHVSGSTKASTITHIAYNSLPFAITLLQGAPHTHK
jgi:membrane protease YdiL (CAAX protease family)